MKTMSLAKKTISASHVGPMLAASIILAFGSVRAHARTDQDKPFDESTLDRAAAAELANLPLAIDPTATLEEQSAHTAGEAMRTLEDAIQERMDGQLDRPLLPDPITAIARHREVRRLARLPEVAILKDEIAAFDDYLGLHRDVLSALDEHPSLVAAPSFLESHTHLASFLEQHPSLSTVLLERAERRHAVAGNSS